MKALTSALLTWEKQVMSLRSEHRLFLQINKNIFQLLRLLREVLGGEKEPLVVRIRNGLIGIAVKNENAVHKWCEKEVSELPHYEKHT